MSQAITPRVVLGLTLLAAAVPLADGRAQPDKGPERGSLVEDRAARKLLEAGDARLEANEPAKAVEVWQSVIERYPRSRVRYDAHLRLGNHLLQRDRAFDRARTHFEATAAEENSDEAQRAEATLKMGVCFYEGRNYGRCFQIMRDVIEKYPVSAQVNQAYYYIGLGHFQLGHYSRAIQSLERVGTTLAVEDKQIEKAEAGKRLFIRIDDADLASLVAGQTVKVKCATASGDSETIDCHQIGRNVRVVLGSIPTALGRPSPNNGRLEIKGGDRITVSYTDLHTNEGKGEKTITRDIAVVGTATLAITDGAFAETLGGVVLGKTVNVQVSDADFDLTDGADVVKAVVTVYREKTAEELGADAATLPADKLERFKPIDKIDVILKEAQVQRDLGTTADVTGDVEKKDEAKPEPAKEDPNVVHTGVFRATLPLAQAETVVAGDDTLQALSGDLIVVTYVDERHVGPEARPLVFKAKCVEGSLGGVRVTQTLISDQELRVKTQLKTASALTNIGNRYKEFGLKQHADAKYEQALRLCEEVSADARKLGGRILEETYVQLWKIYYEMDKLELAAAVSQRLQKEFPNSEFVDEALLALADVARKQGQLQRAIGIYNTLVRMSKSQLRGEAQYGIGECYEEMAKSAGTEAAKAQMMDRAFQEYKQVFDRFPDSGRVGEAVAKMANYYYQQKDYARAVDTFESVLQSHPDAKFLDVILFNYGRCLYRMERKGDARKQFDHLIQDFPESTLAADAKKISEALRKAGF
jgi:TolA-binding protein